MSSTRPSGRSGSVASQQQAEPGTRAPRVALKVLVNRADDTAGVVAAGIGLDGSRELEPVIVWQQDGMGPGCPRPDKRRPQTGPAQVGPVFGFFPVKVGRGRAGLTVHALDSFMRR
jgi:hypothetical protein